MQSQRFKVLVLVIRLSLVSHTYTYTGKRIVAKAISERQSRINAISYLLQYIQYGNRSGEQRMSGRPAGKWKVEQGIIVVTISQVGHAQKIENTVPIYYTKLQMQRPNRLLDNLAPCIHYTTSPQSPRYKHYLLLCKSSLQFSTSQHISSLTHGSVGTYKPSNRERQEISAVPPFSYRQPIVSIIFRGQKDAGVRAYSQKD